MNVRDDEKFIRNVEGLIDPMEVGQLSFFQGLKKLLPRAVFKKLLIKTSKQTPKMGFVIEPYSLFLFFRLKDLDRARAMLPDRYELAKTRIFAGDEPEYYYGFGSFNARASTFWGSRHESYLIARDKETGLISWIFIDILSNTIIALPREGVADPNSRKGFITINPKGRIFLDFAQDGTDRRMALTCDIGAGKMRPLDQPIWVNGNTSIAHSVELQDKAEDPFAVIFDPAEVEEALDIPVSAITMKANTLFPGLADPEPCLSACFPYAQHYIADSPGCRTYVRDREDMIDKYNAIADREDMKTFSTKALRTQFFLGIGFSFLSSIVLLIILLFRI